MTFETTRDPEVNIEDLHARIIQLEESHNALETSLKKENELLWQENQQLKEQVGPLSSSPTIEDFFFWLQKEVHKNGIDKGWWAGNTVTPLSTHPKPLEVHALIHSEISEATEEVRKETPPIYTHWGVHVMRPGDEHYDPVKQKPEGEAVELADAVIIIMSYFESKGWNLGQAIHLKHEHNKTRPHREGYRKY